MIEEIDKTALEDLASKCMNLNVKYGSGMTQQLSNEHSYVNRNELLIKLCFQMFPLRKNLTDCCSVMICSLPNSILLSLTSAFYSAIEDIK